MAEIRALVPYGTPYMACTATATRSVHEEVIRSLEMSGCVRISKSPDRPNIFYRVKSRTDVESDFADLLATLKDNLQTPYTAVHWTCVQTCMLIFTMSLQQILTTHLVHPSLVTTDYLGCFMQAHHSIIRM